MKRDLSDALSAIESARAVLAVLTADAADPDGGTLTGATRAALAAGGARLLDLAVAELDLGAMP
jgi:hypothetical protein